MKNRNNPLKEHQVTIVLGDGFPLRSLKQGRNDLCYCGSGKKSKHCHGVKEKYFTTKPKETTKTNTHENTLLPIT